MATAKIVYCIVTILWCATDKYAPKRSEKFGVLFANAAVVEPESQAAEVEPESKYEPFNTSAAEEEPMSPEPESGELFQTALFVVLYSMCMVFIICGNILVVVIVLHSQELRSNTSNLYLLSLVTARAAVGVFVVPAGIASMFSEREMGAAFCRICHYFATTSGAASVFSIISIAIVKYRSTVLGYPANMTMKQSVAALLCVWAVSLVYAVRTPIVYDLVIVDVNTNLFYSCTVSPEYKTLNSIFIIVDAVCLFAFPLVTIFFCYSRVIRKLSITTTLLDTETKKTTMKAIHMLIILMTLFTLCTLPPYALKIYVNWIAGPFEGMNTVMMSVNLFSYSNGWFNLIVFAVYRDDLRRGLRNLSWVRRCRVQPVKVAPEMFVVDLSIDGKDSVESNQYSNFKEYSKKTNDHTENKRREAMLMMEF